MKTKLSLPKTTEPKHTQTLESILNCLDSIPKINSGGCGISALAIYRGCKKNGIEISDRPFIFLWRAGDEWEAQTNDAMLSEGKIDLVEVPSHIMIEVHDGNYDSTGLQDDVYPYTVRQEYKLSEAELLNVVNRVDGWNDSFKRARHIGKIELGLGVDLSDIKR
jgi:hypothetical protein